MITNFVVIFLAVYAAIEVSKFSEGKRKMIRDKFIRIKRTIIRKIKKISKK